MIILFPNDSDGINYKQDPKAVNFVKNGKTIFGIHGFCDVVELKDKCLYQIENVFYAFSSFFDLKDGFCRLDVCHSERVNVNWKI